MTGFVHKLHSSKTIKAPYTASPPLVYFSSRKREQNKPVPSSIEQGNCVKFAVDRESGKVAKCKVEKIVTKMTGLRKMALRNLRSGALSNEHDEICTKAQLYNCSIYYYS
jgi:hypothetical protein